MAYQAYDP